MSEIPLCMSEIPLFTPEIPFLRLRFRFHVWDPVFTSEIPLCRRLRGKTIDSQNPRHGFCISRHALFAEFTCNCAYGGWFPLGHCTWLELLCCRPSCPAIPPTTLTQNRAVASMRGVAAKHCSAVLASRQTPQTHPILQQVFVLIAYLHHDIANPELLCILYPCL